MCISRDSTLQFDAYLRSLSLHDTEIKLVTDGQLPLRQCLHREASAKDVELPAYYNRFSDLRKEFLRYKSGDLARALVPVKDVKKMLQAPTLPMPQSIAEMLGGMLQSFQILDLKNAKCLFCIIFNNCYRMHIKLI